MRLLSPQTILKLDTDISPNHKWQRICEMETVADVSPMTTVQRCNGLSENLKSPKLPAHRSEIDDGTTGPKNAPVNGGLQLSTPASAEEAEEVVGFSIGQRQNYMRSARTPAAEKSLAIDRNADSYFDIEPPDETVDEDQERNIAEDVEHDPPSQARLPHQQLPRSTSPKNYGAEALPSPWKPGQALQQRSAATRAFLADGFTSLRRRASSGPSTLTENVRKLILELPSLSLPNFGNMLKDDNSTPPTGRPKVCSTLSPNDGTPEPFRPSEAQLDVLHGVDGNFSTTNSLRVKSPDTLLRHSTSDSSLYLRRGLSHTTTLDDTSKWDNVSEQVNSRFKAITDSFQDSRIRLPKVPSINFPSFRPSGGNTLESDPVRENAIMDAQQIGFTRSPDSHQPSDEAVNMGVLQKKADVASAEHRAHPIMAKVLEGLTGDIIVLGGYRGSILRSAKPPYRQLWVPVKVGLNLRKVNLEVGLTHEDEERMEDTIFASGVLSHIGPVDICRRLLRHLHKCPNTKSGHLRIHDYGYDWRLSPHLSSKRLLAFVEKLQCNQPSIPAQQRGVTVISHSLGGLITRHAVNLRPELFAGVVYAGVPQRCVNILGPLRNGDSVLLSSRVLTAQVNFTMRTSFVLLPEDGKCFIDRETGERYDMDFFDASTWDEYRLSPCIKPPLASGVSEHRKGLISALSESLTSLPSAKRSSWGFVRDASPDQGPETISGKARNAVSETMDTAANAALEVTNPDGNPPALEPEMGQPYNRGSIATACTIPRDEAVTYLSRTLREVRQFKAELGFKPEHESNNVYPPIAYMFAKSTPTVYGARVASREAIKYTEAYDDLAFAAGDGVVLASAAIPPKGYRCVKNGKVETDRGHVGLLGDIEGVGRALQAIIEARAKGVGLGTERRRPNEDNLTLSVRCTVDGPGDGYIEGK